MIEHPYPNEATLINPNFLTTPLILCVADFVLHKMLNKIAKLYILIFTHSFN